MVAKSRSRLTYLRDHQKMAEQKVEKYERRILHSLLSLQEARKKVRYYRKKVEEELKKAPKLNSTIRRIVEV
jgi:hypothetical protein